MMLNALERDGKWGSSQPLRISRLAFLVAGRDTLVKLSSGRWLPHAARLKRMHICSSAPAGSGAQGWWLAPAVSAISIAVRNTETGPLAMTAPH
jgi:hypothetical protein